MKKTQMHDTTLTIRLPKALHSQFEQIADAQFMKMGELIRQLMKEEIRKASPYINPVAQNEAQIIRKGKVIIGQPMNAYELSELRKKQAMSPQERKAYEEEQANDDWAH
jgi:hypothetical protein